MRADTRSESEPGRRGGLMNIEFVLIDKIIPYARNQRKHSDDQVKKIASSIREFGFKNPVIVDKDMSIIAGHGRCLAAEKLGLDKVPVIIADDLNEAQIKAYRLADNRLHDLSEFDMDLVSLELEELRELDFNLELTGFASSVSIDELEECELPELSDGDREPFQQMAFKLHDEQADSVKRALKFAIDSGANQSDLNENRNGNAIAFICEYFLMNFNNGQS